MHPSQFDSAETAKRQNGMVALPATICDAVQWDIRSKFCDRALRICVFKPADAPPQSGYPVIYVTDGNVCFGTAAMQARLVERPDGVSPALIVGIGYPVKEAEAYRRLRIRDFTFQEPAQEQKDDLLAVSRLERVTYGGAEDFYRFITEELEPNLAERYRLNKENQALFGFSLGGMFVLHTLFKYPRRFRTYIAGSPAICWNDRAVLAGLSEFRRMVEAGEATPRVLITVGSREQSTDALRVPAHMSREEFERKVNGVRMIDNARELAADLGAIEGRSGYQAEFHVFEGETHGSVIAAAISRAVSFAR